MLENNIAAHKCVVLEVTILLPGDVAGEGDIDITNAKLVPVQALRNRGPDAMAEEVSDRACKVSGVVLSVRRPRLTHPPFPPSHLRSTDCAKTALGSVPRRHRLPSTSTRPLLRSR